MEIIKKNRKLILFACSSYFLFEINEFMVIHTKQNYVLVNSI